eukprot:354185-Chlamydomonas_euryale.AAC.2
MRQGACADRAALEGGRAQGSWGRSWSSRPRRCKTRLPDAGAAWCAGRSRGQAHGSALGLKLRRNIN